MSYSPPKSGGALPKAKRLTRDRWPFLDEPDCPVELHALVGHRITMYHEYSNLYQQLRGCQSLTELSTVCGKLLDAYIDNQQCFRELEYYGKHRKLLGRHPQLRHLQQLSRLRAKTTRQLFEERKRTMDNIWRARNEIAKGDKPHLTAERKRRIKQYELKLKEINNLLGDE